VLTQKCEHRLHAGAAYNASGHIVLENFDHFMPAIARVFAAPRFLAREAVPANGLLRRADAAVDDGFALRLAGHGEGSFGSCCENKSRIPSLLASWKLFVSSPFIARLVGSSPNACCTNDFMMSRTIRMTSSFCSSDISIPPMIVRYRARSSAVRSSGLPIRNHHHVSLGAERHDRDYASGHLTWGLKAYFTLSYCSAFLLICANARQLMFSGLI